MQPNQEQMQHGSSAQPPLFRYLFSLDDYFVGPLTLRDSPLAICALGSCGLVFGSISNIV
jgi:hypothetical protein